MFVRNTEKAKIFADEIKRTINDKIEIRIIQIDFLKINDPGVMEAAVK